MTKKKLAYIILIIAATAAAGYFLWWYVYLPLAARTRAPAGSLLESILSKRVDLDNRGEIFENEGYKDNYFVAYVTGVGVSAEKIDIEIDLGHSGDTHATEKKTVSVQCPPDKTTIASSGFDTLTQGITLLDEVEVDDVIWTYCLDDFCSEIGKECILMKSE
ncbi:hypothetical protein GTO10_03820 [Candidatus Saccharibacteria bacterium]|nr:hypothetical protein [Candidatus Saccharibacteria bacterium]